MSKAEEPQQPLYYMFYRLQKSIWFCSSWQVTVYYARDGVSLTCGGFTGV